jgi:hypothetical protein
VGEVIVVKVMQVPKTQVGSDVKRIARVEIAFGCGHDGVSVICSRYSSTSLMSDPTMLRRVGPDTTTMQENINDRIQEFLQFMKMRGFTSV